MKIKTILEAKYHGNPRAAIEFLQLAKAEEESFLEDDEDEDDYGLADAYHNIIQMIKSKEINTYNDLEQIGDMVYRGTGSGDTDLSIHIQSEVGRLLGIKVENQ